MIETSKLQWALEKTLNRDYNRKIWKVINCDEPVRTEVYFENSLKFTIRPNGEIEPNELMIIPELLADFAVNYRLNTVGKEPIDKTPLYKSAENINQLDHDSTDDRFMIIRDKNKDIACALVLPHNSVFKIALSGGYLLSDSMETHQND